MEWPQRGRVETCSRMPHLPAEQSRAYPSDRTPTAITHSRAEMGGISMDFITGLPQVQGRDCIYVVVDRLTTFSHFFAIPSKFSATQVA